jgi:hypothetical protein
MDAVPSGGMGAIRKWTPAAGDLEANGTPLPESANWNKLYGEQGEVYTVDSGGWQGLRYGNRTRAHQEECMLDCYRLVRKGATGGRKERVRGNEQGGMNM